MEQEKVNSGSIVDFKVLKRLLKFVRPYQGRFYGLIFLTISLGVIAPLRPFLIQLTIDQEVAAGDYNGLLKMISLLVGLLVLQSAVQYPHTYLSGWLGQHIIKDIRTQLYAHLVKLRLKFFDRTPIWQETMISCRVDDPVSMPCEDA